MASRTPAPSRSKAEANTESQADSLATVRQLAENLRQIQTWQATLLNELSQRLDDLTRTPPPASGA